MLTYTPSPLLIELRNTLQARLHAALLQLPLEKMEQWIAECHDAPCVLCSGMGKSGLVAKKMAATLSSIGQRAMVVHPVDALHGDIGAIQSGDLAILLSKSGETTELVRLASALRQREVRTWAITSNPRSRLAQVADVVLILPPIQELDPFDLVPTSSTTLQMMVGDLLAVSLMQRRQVALETFHANHPAGRIGRRLSLRVSDVMLQGEHIPQASPDALILDLIARLSAGRSGCLLLTKEERLCGIFTDGDLRRALEQHGAACLEQPVRSFASARPRKIWPQALATEAIALMEANPKQPITALPVVEHDKLVGLVRLHDLLQAGI